MIHLQYINIRLANMIQLFIGNLKTSRKSWILETMTHDETFNWNPPLLKTTLTYSRMKVDLINEQSTVIVYQLAIAFLQ